MTMGWIWKLLTITRGASPELKASIREMLERMEGDARTTKLPIDDIAVGTLRLVCQLLGLV